MELSKSTISSRVRIRLVSLSMIQADSLRNILWASETKQEFMSLSDLAIVFDYLYFRNFDLFLNNLNLGIWPQGFYFIVDIFKVVFVIFNSSINFLHRVTRNRFKLWQVGP